MFSNLCEHTPSRRLLVASLLTMLHGIGTHGDSDRAVTDVTTAALRPLKRRGGAGSSALIRSASTASGVDGPLSSVASDSARRVLELLASLARLGSVRLFLFRTQPGWNLEQPGEVTAASDSKEAAPEQDSKEDAPEATKDAPMPAVQTPAPRAPPSRPPRVKPKQPAALRSGGRAKGKGKGKGKGRSKSAVSEDSVNLTLVQDDRNSPGSTLGTWPTVVCVCRRATIEGVWCCVQGRLFVHPC